MCSKCITATVEWDAGCSLGCSDVQNKMGDNVGCNGTDLGYTGMRCRMQWNGCKMQWNDSMRCGMQWKEMRDAVEWIWDAVE